MPSRRHEKFRDITVFSGWRSGDEFLLYSIYKLGKSGEGKTRFVNAVGRRLCYDGVKTLFYSTILLFEEFAAERAAGTYLRMLKN